MPSPQEYPLEEARYANLVTFRRDGRPVATPIWHVVLDGRMYFGTMGHSGKARRLRNHSRLRFAVCDAAGKENFGPWYEGRATLVSDPALNRRVEGLLGRKYRWWYALFRAIYALRRWKRAVYEVDYRLAEKA